VGGMITTARYRW